MNIKHKYSILYISYYPWSNQGSRYTNLALALSRNQCVNKLLFVNPLKTIGNIREIMQNKREMLHLCNYRRATKDPLDIYSCIAPVPFKETLKCAKELHRIWFHWAFKKLTSLLPSNKCILIIQKPSEEALSMISIAKDKGSLVVFDWADLFEQFAGSEKMQRDMSSLCKEIASMSDIVFCVSPYLNKMASAYNRNSFILPNAVLDNTIDINDVHIRDREIRLGHPRVCYYGLINPVKLDYDLINEISTLRPKWRLIFIGPRIDPTNSNSKISGKNIEFHETLESCQLHKYIRSNVDICFNPYRIDDLPNNACSPMKLYETLGDGLPFVSTEAFDPINAKDLISMGRNAEDIISKIEYELENDSIEKRKQRIVFAMENTWEKRADEMISILDDRFTCE